MSVIYVCEGCGEKEKQVFVNQATTISLIRIRRYDRREDFDGAQLTQPQTKWEGDLCADCVIHLVAIIKNQTLRQTGTEPSRAEYAKISSEIPMASEHAEDWKRDSYDPLASDTDTL